MAFSSLSSQQRVMVLLELLGGPKFAAEMRGAAASSALLGKTVDKTGKQIQVAGRRTFLTNQALYTLRRYAFYGTIALTAVGAALVKIGYGYLSAMQTARVALSPVIKDQATLNKYLKELFVISKYSPFVITDLAVSFRQLYAGLHPVGIEGPRIIKLMQALTDFMSASGKISPGQMQRVALAIQHLAYTGRVTGYAANQLGRLGIPVAPILRSFGITDVRNLSKQNISADAFIRAIIGYSNTGQFKNAARRQALKTLPGLFQVARDTISQISGNILRSTYGTRNTGLQGLMTRLFRRGGSLDKISSAGGGGTGTLFVLNKQITGNTGLAHGLLLLLSILKNLARVFGKIFIPGLIIGAHALIIFYPVLKLVNLGLGFMANHATALKWIIAALAAEFFITHFALLGLWTATKLWNIATLGSVRNIKWLINFMSILTGVSKGTMLVWAGWLGIILAIVLALRKLDRAWNSSKQTQFRGGKWNPVTWLAWPGQKILGRHAAGGMARGLSLVGEHGPELASFPTGTRIIPNQSVNNVLSMAGIGGGSDGQPIILQVVLDRKVVAEAVARARQDKQARR